MIELARRGHRVTGFDATPEMVAYARDRLKREEPAVRHRVRVSLARMEAFRLRGPFDLVFCLLSTFKYLLTEKAALAHLRRVARVLAPGGLGVVGLHLTDYGRTHTDRETWRGTRDGVGVVCETITRPPDAATRLEWLRNRLTVRHHGRAGSNGWRRPGHAAPTAQVSSRPSLRKCRRSSGRVPRLQARHQHVPRARRRAGGPRRGAAEEGPAQAPSRPTARS